MKYIIPKGAPIKGKAPIIYTTQTGWNDYITTKDHIFDDWDVVDDKIESKGFIIFSIMDSEGVHWHLKANMLNVLWAN